MSLHVQRQTSLCSGWSVWQPACLMRMQHINYAWADAGMQSSHLLPEARYWNRRCQLCLIQGPPALRGAYRVWRCCGMQSGPFIGLTFFFAPTPPPPSPPSPPPHPPPPPIPPPPPVGITPLPELHHHLPQPADVRCIRILPQQACSHGLSSCLTWSIWSGRMSGQSQCHKVPLIHTSIGFCTVFPCLEQG